MAVKRFIKKPKSTFADDIYNWWLDITGQNARKHTELAETMAQEAQDFNEQYSEKQLQQAQAQFDKTFAQSQENLQFQKDVAAQNFAMQQDVFNAQLRENEIARQREDTAYQRQIADLKAAGFSPLMASNGAGAAAMNVGAAPQYDVSGISTVQGSAIDLAREYAELKNMMAGQYLTRRQDAINQRIGAQMAFKEISQQRQSLALNVFNQAVNTAKTIAGISTQIGEYQWNKAHGFRNQNTWSILLPVLSTFADKLGIDYDKLGNAFSNIKTSVTNSYNNILHTPAEAIQKSLEKTLPGNKLDEDSLTNLTMYVYGKAEQSKEVRQYLQEIYDKMPSIHKDYPFIQFYELFTSKDKNKKLDFFKKYFPDWIF